MNPPVSIILLTTLIGAGQGLFLALFAGQCYALASFVPSQPPAFYAFGSVLALLLLVTGLAAAFFHLGRPERAWRAVTQWRSSWLSREVLLMPLVIVLVAAFGLDHGAENIRPYFVLGDWFVVDSTQLIGLAATLASLALFVSTAMIYAGLPFPEEWRSPLTVANFTLLGLSSGFLLATAYAAWLDSELVDFYGLWSVVFTTSALLTRLSSLNRSARLRPRSTLQGAIGMRHQVLVQVAQGATGGSFNTREFFHNRCPATLRLVRHAFLVLVFLVPILLMAAAYLTRSASLPILAFACQLLGLGAERWYFFAEVRHPQNLYYQRVA